MSRHDLDYRTVAPSDRTFEGFDPSTPEPGFYKMRLRSGGVFVGVRIWWGNPIEPWTGEEMDRAPRWNSTVNGKWIDLERVWPSCAKTPIDEAEHYYLCKLQAWGAEHGHAAIADPRKKLDPMKTPVLF